MMSVSFRIRCGSELLQSSSFCKIIFLVTLRIDDSFTSIYLYSVIPHKKQKTAHQDEQLHEK